MAALVLIRPVMASASRGLHSITGNTLVAGVPDTPVARRVQLLQSTREPLLVAEAWSEAAGAVTFEGVIYRPPGSGYTMIGYDHTGVHDPVAKANLVPSPLPPNPAEHV